MLKRRKTGSKIPSSLFVGTAGVFRPYWFQSRTFPRIEKLRRRQFRGSLSAAKFGAFCKHELNYIRLVLEWCRQDVTFLAE
jgi:hypothetical protein